LDHHLRLARVAQLVSGWVLLSWARMHSVRAKIRQPKKMKKSMIGKRCHACRGDRRGHRGDGLHTGRNGVHRAASLRNRDLREWRRQRWQSW